MSIEEKNEAITLNEEEAIELARQEANRHFANELKQWQSQQQEQISRQLQAEEYQAKLAPKGSSYQEVAEKRKIEKRVLRHKKREEAKQERRQKRLANPKPKRSVRWYLSQVLAGLIFLALFVVLSGFTYYQSQPKRYEVRVGERSTVDVSTTRAIVDREKTELRAKEAAQKVQAIEKRSEQISKLNLARLEQFLIKVQAERNALGQLNSTLSPSPASNETATNRPLTAEQLKASSLKLRQELYQTQKLSLEETDATILLGLPTSFYQDFAQQLKGIAEQLMSEAHDQASLQASIDRQVSLVQEARTSYKSEYGALSRLLKMTLQANVEFDEVATNKAKAAEEARIFDDPVMIPAGTRILTQGEVVTQSIYEYMKELNLVYVPGLDLKSLLPILLLMLILMGLTVLFLMRRRPQLLTEGKERWLLLLVCTGLLITASYTLNFSVYANPLYCLVIIICLQFGFEIGLVLGLLSSLAVLPILVTEPLGYLPMLLAFPIIAYVADEQRREPNTLVLMLASTLSPFFSVFILALFSKIRLGLGLQNAAIAALAGLASAVLAIGLQPLLELLTSAVSAGQLIRLSQPSNALLRRLFIEAPGTYQHSMMVANLAEKGAEVIDADTLLVRVGAYYHDIGKMMHPEVFTENQSDYNPHHYLSAEDSVKLIIGHVEEGLRIAKQHRLPERLQDFIREHHGNTLQASFYAKACEKARERGEEEPTEAQFRYPWPIPQSKETAILMLADSLEAAMRSTQTRTVPGAEDLARKIVRIKTEQNQLVDSGLSYFEVEKLIESFVKVYRGQFHDRVQYPELKKKEEEKRL